MRRWLCSLMLVAFGCGPGQAAVSGESSSSTGETPTSTGETSAGESSGTEIGGSETETGTTETGTTEPETTTTGEPACGNGIVEPGELCDGPSPEGVPCSDDCLHEGRLCHDIVFECGNAMDDDGDGRIDLDDPDCLSACDHSEDEFSPSMPGGAADPVRSDCYWDSNTGAGDDKCGWDFRCDPLGPGAPNFPYDPDYWFCPAEQDPECLDNCLPLTPNGCDCFGCCELDGATIYLGFQVGGWGDDKCGVDKLEACAACTIYEACFNPCEPGACELCFLQSPDALDGSCDEPACDPGVESCASSYGCPEGTVCKTGCCLAQALY